MAKDGLVIVNALNSEIEFSDDGGTTYTEIPFTGDIEASGGEAPTTEVVTFKRTGTVVGHQRVPSLTVQVSSYVPHHSTWRSLAGVSNSGTALNFRIRTQEKEISKSGAGNTAAIATTGAVTLAPLVAPISGNPHSIDWRSELYGIGLGITFDETVLFQSSGSSNTAAIATTGVVTFAGTSPPVSAIVVGNVIRVGGVDYPIASVSGTNVPTVAPAPSAAVLATANYSILNLDVVIYTVDTISDTGVLAVDPAPSSAVTATVYSVVNPRLRLGPFLARITTLAPFTLPSEGQFNTTLGLQPLIQLPQWEID